MSAAAKSFDVPQLVISLAIVTAITVRIPWLRQPFVDAWAWRQSDTGMIARNFYEGGFNLLLPQVNWGGAGPGYVGTEFPLVPFLAALVYLVFGEHEWIGRSISLLFFLISLPFFYCFCRDTWNAHAARLAIVFFLFAPLTLTASSSFTSDMTACSFAIMALGGFARWLREPRNNRVFAAMTFVMTLALLVKISYLLFGLPMLYMAWEKWGFGLFRQAKMWIFASVTLLVSGAWYLHAYLITLDHFPHYFFGEGMLRTVALSVYRDIALQTFFWGNAQSSIALSGLTPVLTLAMAAGLFLRPRARYGWAFHWLLLATVVFTYFAGLGSRFPAYQLPVVVVAAALGGRACDAALRFAKQHKIHEFSRLGILAIFLGTFLWVSAESASRFYHPWATPYQKTGMEIDRMIPKDALIVVAADLEPTTFYYSRRKGWSFDTEPASFVPARGEEAVRAIETYRALGAEYFVVPVFNRDVLDDSKFRQHLDTRY